ncbi:MAG: non-heme iron oxygenase ferredoxin subunit [Gammaproteobacteria bacterium]
MPKFIAITPATTIKKGRVKPFSVGGHNLLIANVEGRYYAMEDRCSHEDSPLSLGCLKGELIDCTLHGSRFNVKTGIPVEEPAVEPVKTFRVRIKDDMIEIELGNL